MRLLSSLLLLSIAVVGCGDPTALVCLDKESKCGEAISRAADGTNGRDGETGAAGTPGSAGSNGAQGKQGIPGTRGDIGAAGKDGETGAVGAPGHQGSQGESGIQGPQGEQGPAGPSGVNGTSCSVTRVLSTNTGSGGALISCTDGTSVLVYDGVDGQNGQPAPATPYTITEIIDPCGNTSGRFDEVLLRLANGTILAHYSSGNMQFLTELGPGSYVTTDNNSCSFTIRQDGTITW